MWGFKLHLEVVRIRDQSAAITLKSTQPNFFFSLLQPYQLLSFRNGFYTNNFRTLRKLSLLIKTDHRQVLRQLSVFNFMHDPHLILMCSLALPFPYIYQMLREQKISHIYTPAMTFESNQPFLQQTEVNYQTSCVCRAPFNCELKIRLR